MTMTTRTSFPFTHATELVCSQSLPDHSNMKPSLERGQPQPRALTISLVSRWSEEDGSTMDASEQCSSAAHGTPQKKNEPVHQLHARVMQRQ